MRTPRSLYESLPSIYVGSGVICLVMLGLSPLVVASVALLFGAAGITQVQRNRARQARPKPTRVPRAVLKT